MSATFSSHIRGFSANSFVDSLRNIDVPQWTTETSYSVGNVVFYGTRKYISASTGVSGTTPPTHLIGSASDGVLNWIFIEALYTTDNNYKNNIYLFYGKRTNWADELSPDTPSISSLDEYQIGSDIIALKKITASKCKLATRRYNWTTGTVYSQYHSDKDPFSAIDYPTPFYVLNSENNIYKCINNNNSIASTSEPTGVSLDHIDTADGYVWFYMGTLSAANALLMSADFFPVDTKTYDDGSNQWLVQENAKSKSISTYEVIEYVSTFTGSVTTTVYGDGTGATATTVLNNSLVPVQVLADNIGTGYTKENTHVIIKDSAATGSGATATAEIYYNSINPTVTITNPGSGYTAATAVITGVSGGTLATATVTLGDIGSADEGKVVGIVITNPGKDYVNGATIVINGDGVDATATLSIVTTGIVGNITLNSGNFGSNYNAANVIIHGDGENASAIVSSITDGAIYSISMTNRGSNYTRANVYIIPGTSGALALPIMAPQSGHGKNIAAELAANTVLITSRINSTTDTDYFLEENVFGFRQVGLISNLIDAATSKEALKDLYIGPAHPDYSGNTLNKIEENSGYVLYINNITKSIRAENQEEEIKIAISF